MSGGNLSLTSIPLPEAARILSRFSGTEVSEQGIRDDLAKGAPVNADGTLNLVQYGAWLLKSLTSEAK